MLVLSDWFISPAGPCSIISSFRSVSGIQVHTRETQPIMFVQVLCVALLAVVQASPIVSNDWGHGSASSVSYTQPIYQKTLVQAAPVIQKSYYQPAPQIVHSAPQIVHAAPQIVHAAPQYVSAPVVHAPVYQKQVVQKVVEPEYVDPNPKYSFAYGVTDPHTGDSKNAEEHLENGVVHGSYSLVEPDGHVRKVTYTADPHSGFNAVVERTGGEKVVAAAPVTKVIAAPVYGGHGHGW